MMLDKDAMLAMYDVIGFGYGYCLVKRKSDGQKGTLEFAPDPFTNIRYYYNFQEA